MMRPQKATKNSMRDFMSSVTCVLCLRKDLEERPDETPLFRPIENGKYHCGKNAAIVAIQRLLEKLRDFLTVVAKNTTTPSAEHECRMPVCGCDRQNSANPLLHGLTNSGPPRRIALKHNLGIYRRTGNERAQVRLGQ